MTAKALSNARRQQQVESPLAEARVDKLDASEVESDKKYKAESKNTKSDFERRVDVNHKKEILNAAKLESKKKDKREKKGESGNKWAPSSVVNMLPQQQPVVRAMPPQLARAPLPVVNSPPRKQQPTNKQPPQPVQQQAQPAIEYSSPPESPSLQETLHVPNHSRPSKYFQQFPSGTDADSSSHSWRSHLHPSIVGILCLCQIVLLNE